MEIGRELDALVAEKVMGLPKAWGKNPHVYDCNPHLCQFGCDGQLKPYSTEIWAAWEIAEKLRITVSPLNGKWCAGVIEDHEKGPDYVDGYFFNGGAMCDTAPHAICLAALKARGLPPMLA